MNIKETLKYITKDELKSRYGYDNNMVDLRSIYSMLNYLYFSCEYYKQKLIHLDDDFYHLSKKIGYFNKKEPCVILDIDDKYSIGRIMNNYVVLRDVGNDEITYKVVKYL